MLRRLPLVFVVSVAVAGCAPAFDVTVGWTVDGDDPAAISEFLPAGSKVRITSTSRAISDARAEPGEPVVTEFSVDDGSGLIQVGNFARVQTQIVAGDEVFGSAANFEVAPGAANAGYQIDDEPVVAAIRLTRGTLTANLSVNGQTCDVAGVSTFSVSLFQNIEPRASEAVVTDVNVACEGSVAVFSHSLVDIDSNFIITATATGPTESFATAAEGKGVRTLGVNTFLNVDLDTAE